MNVIAPIFANDEGLYLDDPFTPCSFSPTPWGMALELFLGTVRKYKTSRFENVPQFRYFGELRQ